MADFLNFKYAIQQQFEKMQETNANLFVVDMDKDELWNHYLDSFPPGTNEIYKERREYDCQCCKQFIKAAGHVVAIKNNQLQSIWDVDIEHPFNQVCAALVEKIKSAVICDKFLHPFKTVGVDKNLSTHDDGTVIRWHHFYAKIAESHFSKSVFISKRIAQNRDDKAVLERTLTEITAEAGNIVLELIDQNSLYRGKEHRPTVKTFVELKNIFDQLPNNQKNTWLWVKAAEIGAKSRIRNTSIGTLLVDISEGMSLDTAVDRFEKKVAPQNYKRSSAVVTAGMVNKAKETLNELGLEPSLHRRYAKSDDITVNNMLFVDRTTQALSGDIFDGVATAKPTQIKNLHKLEKIGIDDFIANIIPKVDKIELLFKNRYENNLMSLIAPVYKDAPTIFSWGNNFSWSYNGEVTDSIKERVKKAGGNVNAILRCSLSWFNTDDLDIHVIEPNNNKIYYSRKRAKSTSGFLDVDMNMNASRAIRDAVENIAWTDKNKLLSGIYHVIIHNYTQRETVDVGFDVEIEFAGERYQYNHRKLLKNGDKVTAVKFKIDDNKNTIKILDSIESKSMSKRLWNIQTEQFIPVDMIVNSPNYWDEKQIGNKHWFFILKNCQNEKETRGFYNEFLIQSLYEQRKVFEILASKLKVAPDPDQLSGLGFSSTKRDYAYFRVSGSFNRVLRVEF